MGLNLLVVLSILVTLVSAEDAVYMCDENNTENWFIYCQGPILEAMNLLNVVNDTKDYVDMPLKFPPREVQAKFNTSFGGLQWGQMNATLVSQFLHENFAPAGSEMLNCTLDDWVEKPKKLMQIVDRQLRQFALDVHGIWQKLCKKVDPDVGKNPSQYSLLYVPNQFIAPGGRFREFYYWDAYWIVKGLIASEMYKTALGMIDNFATIVMKYGFIPNGGRVYYLGRSQPPLFTGMLYEWYQATGDKSTLPKYMDALETEMSWWDSQRTVPVTVAGTTYTMYQYRTGSNTFRPESFKHDYYDAQRLNLTDDAMKKHFKNVASTCESGWDFSSRWFADQKNFDAVETTNIVPVDLNAFINWNMEIMEYFYAELGNTTRSQHYRERKLQLRRSIQNVFYSEEKGAWFDYNLRTNSINPTYYASVVAPLFTDSFNLLEERKADRLVDYLKNSSVLIYPEGVPTSLLNSSQQWDFPNGWGNLNHLMAEGLRKSRSPTAQKLGFKIAQDWVRGNMRVWTKTKHMWEKYDVAGNVPEPGFGGLYDVQDGFGWTNGAVLDLLVTYSDIMTSSDTPTPTQTPKDTKGTRSSSPMLFAFILMSIYFLLSKSNR